MRYLREERAYADFVQFGRDQHARAKRDYGSYLRVQMKEAEDRRARERQAYDRFLEEARLESNTRDAEERRRVRQVDVNRSSITFGH